MTDRARRRRRATVASLPIRQEVQHALAADAVSLHAQIQGACPDLDEKRRACYRVRETTPGRMLLSEILPKHNKVPFESG